MERPTHHASGKRMDYTTLDASPRLGIYYASRERIEIEWEPGWGMYANAQNKTRCYIGKSTGWAPCWLMILRRNSSGGVELDMKGIKSIRPLGIYKDA